MSRRVDGLKSGRVEERMSKPKVFTYEVEGWVGVKYNFHDFFTVGL